MAKYFGSLYHVVLLPHFGVEKAHMCSMRPLFYCVISRIHECELLCFTSGWLLALNAGLFLVLYHDCSSIGMMLSCVANRVYAIGVWFHLTVDLCAGQSRLYVRFWCVTVFNWLILPVSICLYQRLSHACLSTARWGNLPGETADGSLNQLWSKWATVSLFG